MAAGFNRGGGIWTRDRDVVAFCMRCVRVYEHDRIAGSVLQCGAIGADAGAEPVRQDWYELRGGWETGGLGASVGERDGYVVLLFAVFERGGRLPQRDVLRPDHNEGKLTCDMRIMALRNLRRLYSLPLVQYYPRSYKQIREFGVSFANWGNRAVFAPKDTLAHNADTDHRYRSQVE
jgi:hypothetical protein